jgi:hypothetical protein
MTKAEREALIMEGVIKRGHANMKERALDMDKEDLVEALFEVYQHATATEAQEDDTIDKKLARCHNTDLDNICLILGELFE